MHVKMPFTKAFLLLSLVLFLYSHSSSPQEAPTSGKEAPDSGQKGPNSDLTLEDEEYEDEEYEDEDYYEDPRFYSYLLDELLDGYDKRLYPTFASGKPTVVETDIYVTSFGPVFDASMEYSLDMFFRQSWKDPRLRFRGPMKRLTFSSKVIDRVWTPDVYFHNSRKASLQGEATPNRLLRLEQDGTLVYTMRVTLTADCNLKFHDYPMDVHTCPLIFSSYGHPTDEVNFVWTNKPHTPGLAVAKDAAQMSQYILAGNWTNRTESERAYGNVSVMTANFRLARGLHSFLLQNYAPAIVTVAASQLTFWLNRESIPARTMCGVTTMLIMSGLCMMARSPLPSVPYATALDWFMSVSLGFVLMAVLMFAAVTHFTKRTWPREPQLYRRPERRPRGPARRDNPARRRRGRRRLRQAAEGPEEIEMQDLGRLRRQRQRRQAQEEQNPHRGGQGQGQGQDQDVESQQARLHNSVSEIDIVCRMLFPLAYLFYNIHYWCANMRVEN